MGAKEKNEEQVSSVRSVEEINALSAATDSILVERLDDAKAGALRRLRQLRVLYQDGSPVGLTDRGVEALAQLPSLEVLDLEWAEAVTDHALAALHGMPRLRWLDIGGCPQITEEAINGLLRAKPQLEIEWW